MKLLIVDDNQALAEGISLYLTGNNTEFETQCAFDGKTALQKLEQQTFDLVVLDILLPDITGYELCKHIKSIGDTPIIFLSSLGEEEDRVKGLLMGGDDYLCKPFSLQELFLRINARLRDKERRRQCRGKEISHDFGIVKLRQRHLTGGEKEVALTETEYKILMLLARAPGTLFSLEEIYHVVWGGEYNHDLRTVQTHTANLRKKLEEAYGTNHCIATQWGQGYIFQG